MDHYTKLIKSKEVKSNYSYFCKVGKEITLWWAIKKSKILLSKKNQNFTSILQSKKPLKINPLRCSLLSKNKENLLTIISWPKMGGKDIRKTIDYKKRDSTLEEH